jgi:glycosyltransferase involved in cell wall biosynthesis
MPRKARTKILFTIPNFITAGSGLALLNIAERLDPDRFEPYICVLKTGGRLEERIHERGIPLFERPFVVPARPIHALAGNVWRAARPFRAEHYDIWHSFHYAADYTEPLIARASGARAWVYSKKNMSWRERAWKLRSVLATRIVTLNSSMEAQFFGSQLLRPKACLIPRGVDISTFSPTAPPRLNVRQQLDGVDDNTVLIGCVAHLVPVKGQDVLIRALAYTSNTHLLLAGHDAHDAYSDSLRRLANEHNVGDRVHFWGNVVDVPALHAELDVFVLPTLGRGRMEGCPVALIEALACGVPSIATDVPGSRDIVESGVSGIIVPPEDPDALALALAQLIQSPELRKRLSDCGRQRVVSNYSIEREVSEHEALYESILS